MAETEAETFSRNWRTGTLGLSGAVTGNRNTLEDRIRNKKTYQDQRWEATRCWTWRSG